MDLSAFSFVSLNNLKRAKSMYLHTPPEIEIDTSYIKQISNYTLGEEIGSGAFGKVVLGLHIITGERVAIKILDKLILSQTPEDYELVKQELSILKIVKHKYIVQLYEILETPQHIFIIMEYCEGQDIMDYILTRTRLSENESLKYFQQLINALYYLHSQNITHRDIKIDNLLLDKNLDLKLIDFGLSTKYRDDQLLNQPCGTVVYAAPEVLDCKEYHGMLADVWSSGIVLFGMLSGFLPFGDPDDEINKKMILQGKIEMPDFFSKEATDLLNHMLDVNPLTRYTLEEIMCHPWFNKNRFKLIPGIIIGINKIPVDEQIVELCLSYNVDRDKVINSVINNKFNNESVLYYLLVKKLKNCGNDSVSDLCSNKFIKYITEETNRIDYINQIQNKIKLNNQKFSNIKKEISKEKINDKDRIRIISQLNDFVINYNYNFNGRNNENDLSAAPGLIKEINFDPKKYNLINIENNFSSHNNSRIGEENYDTSNIINLNMNLKDNSSYEDSNLRKNLGEIDFHNKEKSSKKKYNDINKNIRYDAYRLSGKGQYNQKKVSHKNKSRIIGLDEYDVADEDESYLNGSKFDKSESNNKKEGGSLYYKGKKNQFNEKAFKINLNKKNSNKFKNQPPLTSRNESIKNNDNSSYYMNMNSTQISNIKKNSKIVPIPKEFYRKININNNNKENTMKNLLPDKKEALIKDLTKKSKINPIVNIPPLNINNNNNKKYKNSYKKITHKRRHLNTNIYENSNDIYHNKTTETKNKLNTQRNYDISNNLFKSIYNKNNNSILSNNERKLFSNNHNNLKQFFKNKLNSKSNESRKKYIMNSLSKEKKINKSNVMNLLDNFHIYQRSKNTYKNNLNSTNKNNSIMNRSKFNKTNVTNNSSKYDYSKNDNKYSQSPLLTFDNNHYQDVSIKNNDGFNTERTRNIFNLKKQSCFDKDSKYLNYINNNNYKKIKSKNIINNVNNSKLVIKSKQNELVKIKIKLKDYYLKSKKLDNMNMKDSSNVSYFNNGNNKINNSLLQTAVNNKHYNQTLIRNNLNPNAMNEDKLNNSRINVTLRNRSIKERNIDNIYKKMNTSNFSSINQLKEMDKEKAKVLNSKNNSIDNKSKTKINSLINIGFLPNYKIKANLSLSKEKNKNVYDNTINNNKNRKKTYHNESSVITYRKKSPFKTRDLSDNPKQKYLNEKTRNNRIPWKIKKKGIDDKLDQFSIYKRYMNKFQAKYNNPFKIRNIKNTKKEHNASFLNNNSRVKNNKYLISSNSIKKALNITSNYDSVNNRNKNILKDYDNTHNNNYNSIEAGQNNYNHYKNKDNNSNNMNINIIENKKKDLIEFRQKKIKPMKIGRNYNNNYENYLTQTNENLSHIKDNSNMDFMTTKNITKSNKKKYNKSNSFCSLNSLNDNVVDDYEFEAPFDLSCLFITNRKINECFNIIGNRLKKYGINLNIKKNVINCSKNGSEYQITINKFHNGSDCLLKDRNNCDKYIICYKAVDKKIRNNKINDIFSKLILNSN